MHTQAFISEMKQKLLAEKTKLEAELKALIPHTELGDDLDSQVQEVEGDEVNQDLMATIKNDLEKINIALTKIQAGNYGLDDEGNEISEERLRVIPWADKAI